MKNAAYKSINTAHDTFIQLVRVYCSVKHCYLNQRLTNIVSNNKREFRHNPWLYAQKNTMYKGLSRAVLQCFNCNTIFHTNLF